MRKLFGNLISNELSNNSNLRIITADLGFGILDKSRNEHKEKVYNVGAAEQLMIGMAIGMAEEGLIPVCYSITPFLLYRPFEFLRNYVNYENINVKLVGSGRDKDYSHDGISHWAEDDELVLKSLPNIKIYKPKSEEELVSILPTFLNTKEPAYLNLKR